ncbi:aminotransferase class I/II-fold pyridoxal phosphate-dependent enzyme [Streptomyces sp. ODS28]|uniref:pyridoxal phosphate-dependent decarboxylase family protein n=1 Tax=Streptomyces sp. ODS28 TaxID=3136688 RepID=UPI0031EC05CF
MDLRHWLGAAAEEIGKWQAEYGEFARHPALEIGDERFGAAFAELGDRLRDNYPFFHPRYAGQMLKPPHPAAVVGHLTAMLINPNNHALDGGPATARMEREAVDRLAAMFGLPQHLGHLTTSGTVANLEALFVARELHPDKGVAYSADAHYTHGRMCRLLGVQGHAVAVDAAGRMDLDALEELLRTGRIGTVVLTAGTTGLGALDPVHEALELRERYGVRLHVDAAYGGFFTLIADDTADGVAAAPYRAIAACDSVVVDPHKHGLQPYGCGAVLFADPSVGRFYQHDSPYTYFTSEELHLGEISLECSRAGAAAAALWLTLRLLPLTADGLGAVLRPGRRAALRWAELLERSEVLTPYQRPELDIVAFLPRTARLSEADRVSAAVMEAGMSAPPAESVFLATYGVTPEALAVRGHRVEADAEGGRILRSVLMKPEHEEWVEELHVRAEGLARTALAL